MKAALSRALNIKTCHVVEKENAMLTRVLLSVNVSKGSKVSSARHNALAGQMTQSVVIMASVYSAQEVLPIVSVTRGTADELVDNRVQ